MCIRRVYKRHKKKESLDKSNTVCEKQEVRSDEWKKEHRKINETTKSYDQKRESNEWMNKNNEASNEMPVFY